MGNTESIEGRRVSFGMDEEERVRVLQGIRLSDHVVNRMKGSSQPSEVKQSTLPHSTPPTPAFDAPEGNARAPAKDSKPPSSEKNGAQHPLGAADLLRRYEQEQAVIQDEILQLAQREREAAAKNVNVPRQQEGSSSDQEKEKAAQMARDLDHIEAELRRHDTFYKEQLGRIEKKNAEMYKLSSQQFHEAASKMENSIRPRPSKPVCSALQAQILQCYHKNLQEVLLCSELVRAYQRCVSAAHKG
ncbi:MICOS complex subunit MIC25 [Tenrec ecaudatus]|uniref:MICOS complex subunit MIC25 n=1 Tax=Tenrec ecaudatus TaxID=94439 RepID=UPI003F59C85D